MPYLLHSGPYEGCGGATSGYEASSGYLALPRSAWLTLLELTFDVLLHRNVQRFRGGLVFKAHRLCVSLNSRLESNKEEEVLLLWAPVESRAWVCPPQLPKATERSKTKNLE